MPGSRTHRAAEIQNAIRQILFREWDPIGVRDVENRVDEYDSCIAPVYRVLVGTKSEEDLVKVLGQQERELRGTARRPDDHLRRIARALLKLDVGS